MQRGDQWYLRGVVSFGISKKTNSTEYPRMCDANYPALYADVTSAMDWIVQKICESREDRCL